MEINPFPDRRSREIRRPVAHADDRARLDDAQSQSRRFGEEFAALCAGVDPEFAEPLDVVSLYVPAAVSLKLLPAIAAKRPGELWINPGAESDELLAEATRLGLRVVETCSIIRVGYRPADFP